MTDEEELPGEPVCLAGRLVGGHVVDPQTYLDVGRFRKAERQRLYERRKRLSAQDREKKTASLIVHVQSILDAGKFDNIALYWPIRGEPDLRPLMTRLSDDGANVLLPNVIEKDLPLEFLSWHPGCEMIRGAWNIPVPANGVPKHPDVVVAPLLGFDFLRYRLGNGGGCYDRTLSAFSVKPLTIGAGFRHGNLPSIFAMPWDIPMDVIVTENGPI